MLLFIIDYCRLLMIIIDFYHMVVCIKLSWHFLPLGIHTCIVIWTNLLLILLHLILSPWSHFLAITEGSRYYAVCYSSIVRTRVYCIMKMSFPCLSPPILYIYIYINVKICLQVTSVLLRVWTQQLMWRVHVWARRVI